MSNDKEFYSALIDETLSNDSEINDDNSLSFEDYFEKKSIDKINSFNGVIDLANREFLIFYKGLLKENLSVEINNFIEVQSFPSSWSFFKFMKEENDFYILERQFDIDNFITMISDNVPYDSFMMALKNKNEFLFLFIPTKNPNLAYDILEFFESTNKDIKKAS